MNESLREIFQYIKKLLKVIGVLILIALTVLGYGVYTQNKIDQEKQNQKEKITLTASYDFFNSKCSNEFPLLVTISNNSDRVVNSIEYDIVIYRNGYSTDISYSSYVYSKDIKYKSDKILTPGVTYSQCWKYYIDEEYEKYNHPIILNFEITNKYIKFRN